MSKLLLGGEVTKSPTQVLVPPQPVHMPGLEKVFHHYLVGSVCKIKAKIKIARVGMTHPEPTGDREEEREVGGGERAPYGESTPWFGPQFSTAWGAEGCASFHSWGLGCCF